MILDTIKWSIRGLKRKKLRTVLTTASIAIGVTSVVLINSIGSIGRQTINQELSSLGLDGITVGTTHKDIKTVLDESDLHLVRQRPEVQQATGINFSFSQLHMRSLVATGVVWGIDTNTSQFMSLEPLYGRMINRRDIKMKTQVCVVDQTIAKAFYKRDNIVGKEITLSLETGSSSFTVVGVVKSGGNILQGLMADTIPSFVYIPYSTMQQLSMKNSFDQIAVQVKSGQDPEQAGEQIVKALHQKNGLSNAYHSENISKQKDSLNKLLNIVTLILSLIAGISLIVAGLGILTVMLISVNERTKEIGIKKSIGASRGIILLEFLVEAFTITLTGSMIGAGVGMFLIYVGCIILKLEVKIYVSSALGAVIFALLIGTIFGVYPASVAARLKPVDALRSL